MKLSGRTVLVTGAGTGMGLVAARQFSQRGNRVVMVARDAERLHRAADALEGAVAYACDVTDARQVDGLVAFVQTDAPNLDTVFLNAGVANGFRLFDGSDAVAHARQEVEVNFLAAIDLTHRFVPIIEKRAGSALIVTTSGVIYAPDNGSPTYSATKAALHSYIRSMRFQLAQNGSALPVFELVSPLVDTPFAAHVKSDAKVAPEEVIAALFEGLEADTLDIRPGSVGDLYAAWRRDPDEAADLVNRDTGV